ncbi:MAG: retropepsin-like aspartic protease [Patescibacteria group bacterium]
MKFDYLKQPNFNNPNQPWVSRPFVPVRLFNGGKKIDIYALVDSGADASLFHSSLAKELGIDLVAGRKQTFFGISSGPGIEVYIHPIRLQVVGASETFEIEAGFTESQGVGAILGQSGFFDRYHIKFERDKERIEITPVKGG